MKLSTSDSELVKEKKVNGLKRIIGLTCELVAKTLPTVKMKTTKGARPTTEDP